MNNHKKSLFKNDKQAVKLEKRKIEFKNCFKQMPVPFNVYADFECILDSVESYEGSCTKKYQDHIPSSFAYKLVSVDDRFSKPIIIYRGKNASCKFIEAILWNRFKTLAWILTIYPVKI